MKLPLVGFVGMTHLGLVSGVAAAEKGFQVICFDQDEEIFRVGDYSYSGRGLDDFHRSIDDIDQLIA